MSSKTRLRKPITTQKTRGDITAKLLDIDDMDEIFEKIMVIPQMRAETRLDNTGNQTNLDMELIIDFKDIESSGNGMNR
jgi:hypothetical protein